MLLFYHFNLLRTLIIYNFRVICPSIVLSITLPREKFSVEFAEYLLTATINEKIMGPDPIISKCLPHLSFGKKINCECSITKCSDAHHGATYIRHIV